MDEDDEDVKNLLISIQSDSLTEQQQSRNEYFLLNIYLMRLFFLAIRTFSLLKRTRRSSKTSVFNDRNNEYLFDEEHLLELLKRLKQQSALNSSPMTSEDESDLFDVLLSKYYLSIESRV